jgi:glycosyltransferase involved in cell wall biosynthesis
LTSYARVAFLPDTFHEVNGVAHTSRHLEAFARRRQIPFLSIHPGPENSSVVDGNVTILQLARGPARVGLDANLDYDPFLCRYGNRLLRTMRAFNPDLIHLTGPGDMGTLGFYLAVRLKIPLVISWHTSLHEYAGHRLRHLLRFLGPGLSGGLGNAAEWASLQILRLFYSRADMVMAPNQELIDLTRRLTAKPVFLMQRGVDTELFSPAKRTRHHDGRFRVGYVGRLTPEKNVRFLAEIGHALRARGIANVEFTIVGEGNTAEWLRANVPNATFTGVLRAEALAAAYADMDLFAFPSVTDTFGNVILEALASSVPCVVTSGGGPKFLVQHDVTGHIAASDPDFIDAIAALIQNPAKHASMRTAAREYALRQSWDSVFEDVFRAYATAKPHQAFRLPIARHPNHVKANETS